VARSPDLERLREAGLLDKVDAIGRIADAPYSLAMLE
jgi:hypothetical protein